MDKLAKIVHETWARSQGSSEEWKFFLKEHRYPIMTAGVLGYLTYKWFSIRRLPPGPWGLPLVGSMFQYQDFTEGRAHATLQDKYGDVASVRIGSELQIWLNSYDIIKDAFVKRSSEFSHRYVNNYFQLLGFEDDIFLKSYDAEWREKKAFLMSALKSFGFGTSSLEGKIQNGVEALVSHLDELQTKAGDGGVCISGSLRWLAVNIMCDIVFSEQYGPNDDELHEWIHAIDSLFNIPPYQQLIIDTLPMWAIRLITPSVYKGMLHKGNEMRRLVRAKVEDHKENYIPGTAEDYTHACMDEWGGKEADLSRIVHNIILVTPDSSDTLPLVIEWLIVYAAKHQDVQKKIHQEMDENLAGKQDISLKDKALLPYLEASILETFRLANIFASTVAHSVHEDVQLRGCRIPKGSSVYANFISVHMDPKWFPNPKDFKPERYFNQKGRFIGNEHVIPFGLGPRACLGQALSKMEIFIIAAKLFQTFHFRFAIADQSVEGVQFGIVRRPSPYKVIISRRN